MGEGAALLREDLAMPARFVLDFSQVYGYLPPIVLDNRVELYWSVQIAFRPEKERTDPLSCFRIVRGASY